MPIPPLALPPAARRAALLKAARVASLPAALAVVASLSRGCAPGADLDALAASLGKASHGQVAPADIRWAPSSGMLEDASEGRWVLFLASADPGGPRDVFRARARVSPEGRVIDVGEAYNLTATPLGDDHALVVRGSRAAFATLAFGQEQSVALIDLAGEGSQNKAEKLSDRAMAWITNLQRTGSGEGIARVDVTFERPAQAVGLALGDAELSVDIADEAGIRRASLDAARGELQAPLEGVHVEAAAHLPKRLSHWAVDTVRAVPWIGPEPIAWLEEKVFALKDDAKRLAFRAGGGGGELAQAASEPAAPVLDTSEASVEAAHWPPAKLTPIWKTPEPGEGEWQEPKIPWMRKLPHVADGVPSAFYRTFVRPDEDRPYAKCLLVAMDLRQLDLEMEAGTEDPQPLTGPHGPGKLPRDTAITSRVVAAWNGAFKTEHGHYGMMVHKRVLLPPQPGAATVFTTKDGRVGLGSWGTARTVTGVKAVKDDEIVSFRQNLDALVDHGNVNPTGRSLWGFSAPGKGIQTERSGICVTQAGHLVYAWGDDVSATTLAKAMRMAGCDYGMHLDMNPYHTGFMFTNIEDVKGKRYRTELLSPGMEISKERFVEWAPKDFFYVMLRDPAPPAVDGAAPWAADGGAQPAPQWMPGLWRTEAKVSGASVELLDVEPGRARFRVRAGRDEPALKGGAASELQADDAKRVLFAAGLGVAVERHPRGLAASGAELAPLSGGEGIAILVAPKDGPLQLVRPRDVAAVPSDADRVELPLVLDGEPIDGTAGTPRLRSALGVTETGRVILARATAESERPLAEALKRAGCTRAVALDRGGRASALLHRAGQAQAPRSRYDESVLFAIATPLQPRGFRFDAEQPYVATAAKK